MGFDVSRHEDSLPPERLVLPQQGHQGVIARRFRGGRQGRHAVPWHEGYPRKLEMGD